MMTDHRGSGSTHTEQGGSADDQTASTMSEYYQTIDDAEHLMCALPPALLDTVRDLLFFVYEVNQRAQELYVQAEIIYAQRTLHSGIGNDTPAESAGSISE
ncbi:MAG: hypothetical protein ACK5C0_07910 [Candidatus Kapaibacterium sp.]|jgi:hypothetical protein|nr:hypothetical protein [Ignavibacteria bacterium]MBN8574994.1 hypothetical protein [Candidatus Kapabacteria bacterium]HRE56696.1 hypothetical protein [Candidatus Kapabacteria bacterium]HRI31425.1 hypothetical protein [Candidatus Kapabacteria bacterium]HRK59115.1 hypothetical protein [Candidatus Kapabacteria bacterium]